MDLGLVPGAARRNVMKITASRELDSLTLLSAHC
jgi:hypothetical protein